VFEVNPREKPHRREVCMLEWGQLVFLKFCAKFGSLIKAIKDRGKVDDVIPY
jgi:hypothetical protein